VEARTATEAEASASYSTGPIDNTHQTHDTLTHEQRQRIQEKLPALQAVFEELGNFGGASSAEFEKVLGDYRQVAIAETLLVDQGLKPLFHEGGVFLQEKAHQFVQLVKKAFPHLEVEAWNGHVAVWNPKAVEDIIATAPDHYGTDVRHAVKAAAESDEVGELLGNVARTRQSGDTVVSFYVAGEQIAGGFVTQQALASTLGEQRRQTFEIVFDQPVEMSVKLKAPPSRSGSETSYSLGPIDNTHETHDTSQDDELANPASILQALTSQEDSGTGTQTVPSQRRKHGRALVRFADFVAWAHAHGRVASPEAYRLDQVEAAGGEHIVFYDEGSGRFFKLTKPGFAGAQAEDAGAYIQRWALANRNLKDEVRIEGVVTLPNEDAPRIIISQPDRAGRDATPQEISTYLQELGFHEHDGRWVHPVRGVTVWDTITEGNVIMQQDGNAIAIDLQIEPSRADELRAVRAKTGFGRQTSFSLGPVDRTDAGQTTSDASVPHQTAPEEAKRTASQRLEIDPRILEAFGDDVAVDDQGLPIPPRPLPDGHPLLESTLDKKSATLDASHALVRVGLLPANTNVTRRQLRQAIITYFLRQGSPVPEGAQPTITAAGGGGASGKSTVLDSLRHSGLTSTVGAVVVNPDDISELIPEYYQLIEMGDSRASELVHQEASRISGTLMDTLLALPTDQRPNIIYDSTLSRRDSALRHFERWRKAGFKIQLLGVTLDVNEATIRAAIRAKQTGRWVPLNSLREAHQGFNQWVKDYMLIVDGAQLYDSSSRKSELVASKTSLEGPLRIENQKLWDIINQRGQKP
jgi:predicted ABC-type ATPase